MRRMLVAAVLVAASAASASLSAEIKTQVVDLPTRDGVTERFLYLAPESAKAALIVFAGGDGGLQIQPDGRIKTLSGNFLVRMREAFVQHGVAVALLDAPSDHQAPNFLNGFRQTPQHVADVAALIAWLRQRSTIPIWLIGTSRGTQSAAFIATQLPRSNGGPDGLVLTSSILIDRHGRPVPQMPLQNIAIPVLVVHHEQDGCMLCPYAEVPNLMRKLSAAPKSDLITITGGDSVGDPCEAFAHHGYRGQEEAVVDKIAAWILSH